MAFDFLPTMAEVNATRRAVQKGAEPSRLQVKEAKRVDEKKEWARAKREVWARDESRDRLTKRKVVKTLELTALRGEVHHVEGREDQAVRFDRRNLILLALETHERVTRHELKIVGTRFFTVAGKKYINCDFKVRFVKP